MTRAYAVLRTAIGDDASDRVPCTLDLDQFLKKRTLVFLRFNFTATARFCYYDADTDKLLFRAMDWTHGVPGTQVGM